jgi:predicted anti-sigma-YlaC factor YlaD
MDCKKANILFDACLDQQMDKNMVAVLENHLSQCKQCRQEFKAYRTAIQVIANDKKLDFDSSLYYKISLRMANKNQFTKTRNIRLSYAAASVAIIAGVFGGHIIGKTFTQNHINAIAKIDVTRELFEDDLNFEWLDTDIINTNE